MGRLAEEIADTIVLAALRKHKKEVGPNWVNQLDDFPFGKTINGEMNERLTRAIEMAHIEEIMES